VRRGAPSAALEKGKSDDFMTGRRLTIALAVVLGLLLVTVSLRRHESATEPALELPSFTANKLTILAKLKRKDFAGLDSELEQYQSAFEQNRLLN